ncbi:hypothetical protein [Paenibacillus spongiae]|uniref:Uncharacterized protein n=1 Tax=Paenibacillus spongiae TaxID=2909671 RepID=A0ABY5SCU5_9BACL|nr:hypothetical protein [Paenibacillus spongiae]UVI30513.1 hypothetical protein L1F29_01060 [Paenibacillus spongiae]
MDVRELVKEIAKELLAAAVQSAPRPKVLFLFCDSRAHEAFSDTFILLENQGIDCDLAFLDGETSAWIGMHKCESSGVKRSIAIDEYAPAPLELPQSYVGIVIPEIDLDNAARIATGMKGSVKSELVFAALLLGKPVWIGKDSGGIKRADRQTLKTLELTPGYAKLFRTHMDALEGLGIRLIDRSELAADLVRMFGSSSDAAHSPNAAVKENNPTPASVRRALITADWVAAHASALGGSLELDPKTIVSPLARDMLKQRGINLQYTSKG